MAPVTMAVLDEVVHLVRSAGEITLEFFGSSDLFVDDKADGTPVTEADRAAERMLRQALTEHFPADAIVGEEEADTVGTSGRTWIIDPIDGTKAFTHGVPLYSNLLALRDEEGPAIGVINLPALGEVVYAGRGLGCWHNGKRVTVNAKPGLAQACICTSGLGRWTGEQLDRMCEAGSLLRTWGDGYGFALVATGRVEAMVDPQVALWDIAPMPIILSEAGGRFTDLGGEVDPGTDPRVTTSGVASNGLVHDELLTLLHESKDSPSGTRPAPGGR